MSAGSYEFWIFRSISLRLSESRRLEVTQIFQTPENTPLCHLKVVKTFTPHTRYAGWGWKYPKGSSQAKAPTLLHAGQSFAEFGSAPESDTDPEAPDPKCMSPRIPAGGQFIGFPTADHGEKFKSGDLGMEVDVPQMVLKA